MSIKKRIESKLIPRVLIWALGRMDLTFSEIGEIEKETDLVRGGKYL